jgi:hypothetical protein
MQESNELCKPMTEFNQTAHPKEKYEKDTYEFTETIVVTT